MHARQALRARADARQVVQVAGAERARESARDGGRGGLAGPAVRVVDRRDRPIRHEAAAGKDQRGHRADEPGLQSGAHETVAG
jgi:hypothetical protein